MGRIYVLHGDREQLIAYLKRHPEAQRVMLIIPGNEDSAGTMDSVEGTLPEGIPVRNGVPLFPELPDMVRLTAELVKRLLDEEETSTD